jgi:muramoyltetrapeptide carboxypeptidase
LCNAILQYPLIDWAALRANPKIVMGYSDITGLSNALSVRGGMVAYQ